MANSNTRPSRPAEPSIVSILVNENQNVCRSYTAVRFVPQLKTVILQEHNSKEDSSCAYEQIWYFICLFTFNTFIKLTIWVTKLRSLQYGIFLLTLQQMGTDISNVRQRNTSTLQQLLESTQFTSMFYLNVCKASQVYCKQTWAKI